MNLSKDCFCPYARDSKVFCDIMVECQVLKVTVAEAEEFGKDTNQYIDYLESKIQAMETFIHQKSLDEEFDIYYVNNND